MARTAHAPTAHDLNTLHVHDRHSALGLTPDDLRAMYRTILLTRVLDQRIWSLNRMGKAPFVVSAQGHEGCQVASAWALRAGHEVSSTRGPKLCSWRENERVLAGFPDGRADEGPTAGPASLAGLEIARERGWTAPDPAALPAVQAPEEGK